MLNEDKYDGVYVVIEGKEYMMDMVTPWDDGKTPCQMCDFMQKGRCVAPSWCLRIEEVLPDTFWKRTTVLRVGKDEPTPKRQAYAYNDANDCNITVTSTCDCGTKTFTFAVDCGEVTCIKVD